MVHCTSGLLIFTAAITFPTIVALLLRRMAKAFGVAAGILAFLSSATVVIKTSCVLVEDVNGADADVGALANELDEFKKVLVDLNKLADVVKQSSEPTIRKARLSLALSNQCLQELTDNDF